MSQKRKNANNLRSEADKLLKHTGLFELLGRFGEVNLGGSYEYDLMVDRDLDFRISIKETTPKLRAEIAQLFAIQEWIYGMKIKDRVNFKPLSNLQAPLGLYLGLSIPFPENRWNIDAWFLVQDAHKDDEITKLVKSASKDQKDTILEIKYDLLQRGLKQKGMTSADIYKAVLVNNVMTTEKFLENNNGQINNSTR